VVIDAMLALAAPRTGDVLYDLGCGDGAIVIRAAEKYGVRAVGLDLDATVLTAARKNAKKRGVTDRVEFIQQDVKSTNLSRATIVTLLLSISGNLLLMPHLQTQLKHGARIVSARFDFPGWKPDRVDRVTIPGEKPWNIYLWHAASFTSPHDAARATSR
jgi:ubiquinone/menaquinone biosynthesis C-methylase UbiE